MSALMKNNASFIYACLLIVGDFLALLAAFSVAYILRVKLDERALIHQIAALEYVRTFLTVLPFWILVHAFIGLYNPNVYERRFKELGRLLVGSFLGILVVIGYDFITDGKLFPARLVPVYGLALGFGFLVLFRTFARYFRALLYRFNIGVSNVLIVGNTIASHEIAEAIADTQHTGLHVVGIVGAEHSKFFKTYESFEEAISRIKQPIHSIIQTELYKDQTRNNAILTHAQENHIAYRFSPGNSDLFVGNIDVELFAGLPVIAVHQTALVGWGRIVKRLFDLIASTTILFFIWPLLVLIGLLVKLFDPQGPVFFKQTRLTRFNTEFMVYKFRTPKARYNSLSPEEAFELMGKPELSKKYRENGDFLPDDPRFSSFGRFLRKSSLDELPQLFNVLLGDLSLVGPRALVPEELAAFEKRHSILSVKSGLTGLAQISGRRNISFDERRKLDVYYVQNWSFWMDIMILIRTVRAVLGGIGAK
jgi:exopolysaccharide biosynthesis polyprenyl glycosylphosphotransferase